MDYKIITGPESIQGSAEWLEWRRSRVCASDMPIIMGESPFKTMYQLYMEKVFSLQNPTTPAMQRGKNLEPVALDWINSRIGPPYFTPVVVESTIYSKMGASLDGLRIVDGITEIIEIKAPGETDHLLALGGTIPPKYRAQLQHSMLVTGCSFIRYISFDGETGWIVHVDADLEYQKEMMKNALAFLALVNSKTLPPTSAKDATEIVDPEANELANKYVEVCDEI